MAKPGPPKKPTPLRILEGNPSKRPLPKNEPKPDGEMPECPEWLSDEAKKEWDRVAPELNKIGLLSKIDSTALAGYCQSYAKWKEAEMWIQEHGSVYPIRGSDGKIKYLQQVPQVGIANQCLKQIRAFCAEFGMTPSARARIELPSGAEDEDDEIVEIMRAQWGD